MAVAAPAYALHQIFTPGKLILILRRCGKNRGNAYRSGYRYGSSNHEGGVFHCVIFPCNFVRDFGYEGSLRTIHDSANCCWRSRHKKLARSDGDTSIAVHPVLFNVFRTPRHQSSWFRYCDDPEPGPFGAFALA
jgi:hypothetical protein